MTQTSLSFSERDLRSWPMPVPEKPDFYFLRKKQTAMFSNFAPHLYTARRHHAPITRPDLQCVGADRAYAARSTQVTSAGCFAQVLVLKFGELEDQFSEKKSLLFRNSTRPSARATTSPPTHLHMPTNCHVATARGPVPH